MKITIVLFCLGIGVDGFARFGQHGRDRFDKRLLRPDRPHSRSTTFQTPKGRSLPAAPSRLAALAGLSRQIVKMTATIDFYPHAGVKKNWHLVVAGQGKGIGLSTGAWSDRSMWKRAPGQCPSPIGRNTLKNKTEEHRQLVHECQLKENQVIWLWMHIYSLPIFHTIREKLLKENYSFFYCNGRTQSVGVTRKLELVNWICQLGLEKSYK